MASEEERHVQGNDLRRVMRRVPSPVVVVTVAEGKHYRGITIGSCTSVSLDPPLVSFNVNKESETHDVLIRIGQLVVNVLTPKQASLAHRFSLSDHFAEEQFAGVAFEIDEAGLPVLAGTLATMKCSIRAVHDVGDHSLFVADVVDIPRQDLEASALLYFDQTYREVGEEVISTAFSPVKRGSSSSS